MRSRKLSELNYLEDYLVDCLALMVLDQLTFCKGKPKLSLCSK